LFTFWFTFTRLYWSKRKNIYLINKPNFSNKSFFFFFLFFYYFFFFFFIHFFRFFILKINLNLVTKQMSKYQPLLINLMKSCSKHYWKIRIKMSIWRHCAMQLLITFTDIGTIKSEIKKKSWFCFCLFVSFFVFLFVFWFPLFLWIACFFSEEQIKQNCLSGIYPCLNYFVTLRARCTLTSGFTFSWKIMILLGK